MGGGAGAGVLALLFLWRRAEEKRALRAHANVAGDGGCGPEDVDGGTVALGRILATGKHGLDFFLFALLLFGGGVVSSAGGSSSDVCGGGAASRLWRRRVDTVSAVDAEEQERLL